MYQPLTTCGAKEAFCSVILWTRTQVPCGARGVRLKLKLPKVPEYADRLGWRPEDCRRFNVMSHFGKNLSHSWIGKFGSRVAIPARK